MVDGCLWKNKHFVIPFKMPSIFVTKGQHLVPLTTARDILMVRCLVEPLQLLSLLLVYDIQDCNTAMMINDTMMISVGCLARNKKRFTLWANKLNWHFQVKVVENVGETCRWWCSHFLVPLPFFGGRSHTFGGVLWGSLGYISLWMVHTAATVCQ